MLKAMLTYRYVPPFVGNYIPPRRVVRIPRVNAQLLARLEPVIREVGYILDVTVASYLPGAYAGETLSNYIARHNSEITGRYPLLEKWIFHRDLARNLGERYAAMTGVPDDRIALFVLRVLEG